MKLFIVVIYFVGGVWRVFADEHNHKYEEGEEVVLWMDTVGPYHNTQETYAYFSLPFCKGSKSTISHYHETLGEALQGTELEFSGLDIQFKVNVEKTEYCKVVLDEMKLKSFLYAVKNKYWHQMFVDNLPIWTFIGLVGEDYEQKPTMSLWSHKKFLLGYNGQQIVDVNVTMADKVLLEAGAEISFTYEVEWHESSVLFSDRFNKYLDVKFFNHRIHWFSILNSFLLVVFLVATVAVILSRTLKKDYARYSKEIEEGANVDNEYGWKQVHGDIFRPCPYPLLLSSLVGSGSHVFVVVLLVICCAVFGDLYMERGSLVGSSIFMYAAISPVNGYIGSRLYSQLGGKNWVRQVFLGALMLPSLVCGNAFLVNFLAIYYHASRAISFNAMMIILSICCFVILPLTLVGAILGRSRGSPEYPCRVNAVPRPIPEKKWFMQSIWMIVIGGVIPFFLIFIEIYFIFSSFWAYKIYYVFGFMLLVFVMLAIATVSITIVFIYFLLNAEDYRWQWTSFLSASSISAYIYLYSIYYFFFKTKMYGLFQTVFFFGYMGVFSLALGSMCGALGYLGTSIFVRNIYSNIKID